MRVQLANHSRVEQELPADDRLVGAPSVVGKGYSKPMHTFSSRPFLHKAPPTRITYSSLAVYPEVEAERIMGP